MASERRRLRWLAPLGAIAAILFAGVPNASAQIVVDWVQPTDALLHITDNLTDCEATLQFAIQFTHVGPSYDHVQGIRMTVVSIQNPELSYGQIWRLQFIDGNSRGHSINPSSVRINIGADYHWYPDANVANGSNRDIKVDFWWSANNLADPQNCHEVLDYKLT